MPHFQGYIISYLLPRASALDCILAPLRGYTRRYRIFGRSLRSGTNVY